MPFEKRKAYIEMLGSTTCRITTPFKQKTFDLIDEMEIDLINLQILKKNQQSSFKASITEIDDQRTFMCVEVWSILEPDGYYSSWGSADLYDNKQQLFQGTIWVPK